MDFGGNGNFPTIFLWHMLRQNMLLNSTCSAHFVPLTLKYCCVVFDENYQKYLHKNYKVNLLSHSAVDLCTGKVKLFFLRTTHESLARLRSNSMGPRIMVVT